MKARSVLVGVMFAMIATTGTPRAQGVARALVDKECVGRKSATRLTVQVGALRSNAGDVVIVVYPGDPSRFLTARGKVARAKIKTSAPMSQACFFLPSPEDAYAVEVYHDADSNGDLSRSPGGMPTEGYGFSNDAPTKFASPAFDAVRFGVKPVGETVIRVKVRYPSSR
ncbi:DUF2141 domain-containing protein [Caulobacter sp.]|uniref:DUF2141 domain-containing protein n=1 Tax=Caulobacter sp. TaxID=78 RepID=UPI001B253AFC|nr:DUF2141 domain-containing protein [Caulobacter sp.]MBO9544785.1 DUF2141 domain-containing protein [Caulobacter sp.]